MKKLKCFIASQADVFVVGLLMLAIFLYVMFGIAYASDLPIHAQGSQSALEEHRLFESNFMVHFVSNLLSGFTGNLLLIEIALVVMIALSNTAKYVIVKKEFSRSVSTKQAMIASAALLFVFVIPVFYFLKIFGVFLTTNNMYFQYCVPNIWHNSTFLCMMPFAIVTYLLSVRQFESFDSKRNWLITLFVALGTLVKPSFFFVYAVAYPICMFVRYRSRKEFFYSLIPVVVGCLCVIYEFATIYNEEDGNEVVISVLPLFTMAFWKSRILYLAVSMALPLLFVLLYGKEVVKDMEFWFVLIMLVVALGIKWCCNETGSRAGHGNFSWQVISAMWFVYYYMLKTVLTGGDALREGKVFAFSRNKVNRCFLALYGIHVVMGVLYLVKYMVTKDMA